MVQMSLIETLLYNIESKGREVENETEWEGVRVWGVEMRPLTQSTYLISFTTYIEMQSTYKG